MTKRNSIASITDRPVRLFYISHEMPVTLKAKFLGLRVGDIAVVSGSKLLAFVRNGHIFDAAGNLFEEHFG